VIKSTLHSDNRPVILIETLSDNQVFLTERHQKTDRLTRFLGNPIEIGVWPIWQIFCYICIRANILIDTEGFTIK
jgi:hypothetical protein